MQTKKIFLLCIKNPLIYELERNIITNEDIFEKMSILTALDFILILIYMCVRGTYFHKEMVK